MILHKEPTIQNTTFSQKRLNEEKKQNNSETKSGNQSESTLLAALETESSLGKV